MKLIWEDDEYDFFGALHFYYQDNPGSKTLLADMYDFNGTHVARHRVHDVLSTGLVGVDRNDLDRLYNSFKTEHEIKLYYGTFNLNDIKAIYLNKEPVETFRSDYDPMIDDFDKAVLKEYFGYDCVV